jgi:hypothetical protein
VQKQSIVQETYSSTANTDCENFVPLGGRKAIEMIFERIETLLNSCETDQPIMPSMQPNNEGWMLRLTLDLFASIDRKDGRHPLTVPLGSRWYSESLLPFAFLPEFRGDSIAESWTHADAFMGHFDIGNGSKGDLTLRTDVRHFVAIEAKMYSKLSTVVKKATCVNETAHNTVGISEVLKRTIRQAQEFKALGFHVLSSQINQGLFDEYLTKTSLRTVVERRVDAYGEKHGSCFSGWFLRTLDRLDIKAICWKDLIEIRYPDPEPLKTSILAAWT